jgi:hypothetical protein
MSYGEIMADIYLILAVVVCAISLGVGLYLASLLFSISDGCMPKVQVYRVQENKRPRWLYRTWQAEWDECPRAPRAWTRAGVERKARQWQRRARRRQG